MVVLLELHAAVYFLEGVADHAALLVASEHRKGLAASGLPIHKYRAVTAADKRVHEPSTRLLEDLAGGSVMPKDVVEAEGIVAKAFAVALPGEGVVDGLLARQRGYSVVALIDEPSRLVFELIEERPHANGHLHLLAAGHNDNDIIKIVRERTCSRSSS